MKNESNFLNEIEDTLHAYEDAYVPGAWEAFQQKRKRRRMAMLFFRAGSAAAILLLAGYAAMQFFAKPDASMRLLQTKNKIHQPLVKPLKSGDENITTGNTIAIDKGGVTNSYRDTTRDIQAFTRHNTTKPIQNQLRYTPANQSASIYKDSTTLMTDNKTVKPNNVFKPGEKLAIAIDTARPVKATAETLQSSVFANNETEKHKADNKPVYDLLVKSKTDQQLPNTKKTKAKSVSYAVVVSPGLGNQKVNFGTGVQVSYHINNNFSVSSGIAYSSLNATASGTASNDPLKKVQGVNLDVSGFEVPLGLQYKTNSGFYVSADVVGMSVVNDHLNYNYLTQNTVATASLNASGLPQQIIRVVSEQKTEESKEKINNYMGFYILSIGKKKAIGRNQINFGPFLRVPFGVVSSEKINLMQGGIHFGFEF